ncbi:polysaccharide pyruvyl transferase family protein [uncultured Bacteroides sp.]|uniref:polysaccharide pyruvyl transferase family protein n=1 Tax=uncultured Bacteroides sp. TaxID=162156 RepID=UPI002607B59B|nr:polysaccharide pyruvyl transferase family protein [uncultured Bacteroides sp.]
MREKLYFMLRYGHRFLMVLQNTLYYYLHYNKILVINAWIKLYKNRVVNGNWGDALNYFFLREIAKKPIVNYSDLLHRYFHMKIANVMCIGSIVDWSRITKESVIWGSGAMYGNIPLSEKPMKVCAVRGPLTREYLLSQGVDCPEIYGDPALLLPRIYHPVASLKKHKIGIIPHHSDLSNEYIAEFVKREKEKVKLIDLRHYSDWHEVIDAIVGCDFIISSSLHGLIVSDAYNIPNVWVEFSDNVEGNGFKFRDYFASVERKMCEPLRIETRMNMDDLLAYKVHWKSIKFNAEKLIAACPFKINM